MDTAEQLAFAVGNRVVIARTDIPGTVEGIYLSRDAAQYSVAYADQNGAVFSRYFRAEELTAA